MTVCNRGFLTVDGKQNTGDGQKLRMCQHGLSRETERAIWELAFRGGKVA
jgi:hypothetical protein